MDWVDRTNLALSRRGFLHLGTAASAALAGGGTILACLGPSSENEALVAAEQPAALSRRDLAVVAAFARRVIAPAPGCPTALEARLARRIDRELAIVGGRLVSDVRAAINLIEFGPWLDLQFCRFSALGRAAQVESLRASERSRWLLRRQAYAGLRLLCLFFYYSDDRTWSSIGYAGPTVARKLPEAANAIEVLDRPVGSGRR